MGVYACEKEGRGTGEGREQGATTLTRAAAAVDVLPLEFISLIMQEWLCCVITELVAAALTQQTLRTSQEPTSPPTQRQSSSCHQSTSRRWPRRPLMLLLLWLLRGTIATSQRCHCCRSEQLQQQPCSARPSGFNQFSKVSQALALTNIDAAVL